MKQEHYIWFDNPILLTNIVHMCIHSDKLHNFKDYNTSGEANSSSDSLDISCGLWKLKVHYTLINISSPSSTLSQMLQVHVLSTHSFGIHFNIITESNIISEQKLGSTKWHFPAAMCTPSGQQKREFCVF